MGQQEGIGVGGVRTGLCLDYGGGFMTYGTVYPQKVDFTVFKFYIYIYGSCRKPRELEQL